MAERTEPDPAHVPTPAPAADAWVALAYAELRSLARRRLAGEGRGHVLQPTALVHEAFLRLRALDRVEWAGRTHFLAVAGVQMRRILVEHARAAAAAKRGGNGGRVTLGEHHAIVPGPSVDVLAVDTALERLGARFPRPAEVAQMRLLAGMEIEEISRVLGVSGRTVKSDWRFARAWLGRELRGTGGATP